MKRSMLAITGLATLSLLIVGVAPPPAIAARRRVTTVRPQADFQIVFAGDAQTVTGGDTATFSVDIVSSSSFSGGAGYLR